MGSEQSTSEYDEKQIINHPKFKKIKFMNDCQVLRTCISIEHEDEVLAWDRKLKQVADCDDQYILLPKSYTYSKKAVCGSSGIIQIDYDNYPYILSEEISNRSPNHNHFTEAELWYLVYGLTSSAHIFRAVGTKIGDVRPDNIFINECGQIRIANLCSWPSERTNYEKVIYDRQLTYISPEEVQDSKQGIAQLSHDKFVCESFSVGVTLLEAGMLRSSSQFYDERRKSFNFGELSKRIQKWFQLEMVGEKGHKERYSWSLKLTIAALCEVNPADRLTCEKVYNWLSPYDSELTNLKSVKMGMPPLKDLDKYQGLMGAGKKFDDLTTPNKAIGEFYPESENRQKLNPISQFITPPQQSYSPDPSFRTARTYAQSHPNVIASNNHPHSQPASHYPQNIQHSRPVPSFEPVYSQPPQSSSYPSQPSSYPPPSFTNGGWQQPNTRSVSQQGYAGYPKSEIDSFQKQTISLGHKKEEDKPSKSQLHQPVRGKVEPDFSFSYMSSISHKQDSADKGDEASLDFLKRINNQIQKSQEKYPGVR